MNGKAYQLPVILPRPAHAFYGAKIDSRVVGDSGGIEGPIDGIKFLVCLARYFVEFCFHNFSPIFTFGFFTFGLAML